jgi:hypothetical protein
VESAVTIDKTLLAVGRAQPKFQVIVAVARELLGFIWAIGIQAEKESKRVLIAQPSLIRGPADALGRVSSGKSF